MEPVTESFESEMIVSLDFQWQYRRDEELIKSNRKIVAELEFDMPESMLKTDPCLYVYQDLNSLFCRPNDMQIYEGIQTVEATWDIPVELILELVQKKATDRFLAKIRAQLYSLRLCTVKDVYYDEFDYWDILQEDYLERFYRKRQFEKLLQDDESNLTRGKKSWKKDLADRFE